MVTSLPFLMLQNYPNFWFYPYTPVYVFHYIFYAMVIPLVMTVKRRLEQWPIITIPGGSSTCFYRNSYFSPFIEFFDILGYHETSSLWRHFTVTSQTFKFDYDVTNTALSVTKEIRGACMLKVFCSMLPVAVLVRDTNGCIFCRPIGSSIDLIELLRSFLEDCWKIL